MSSSNGLPYLIKITIIMQFAMNQGKRPTRPMPYTAMYILTSVSSLKPEEHYFTTCSIKVMRLREVPTINELRWSLIRNSFETMPVLASDLVKFIIRFKA